MKLGLNLHQLYQWLIATGKPRDSGYVTVWQNVCLTWHSELPDASTLKPGVLMMDLTASKWLIATGGSEDAGAERWSELDEAAPTPPQPSAHG